MAKHAVRPFYHGLLGVWRLLVLPGRLRRAGGAGGARLGGALAADAQGGGGNGRQACGRDRLIAVLALAVGAVRDALERLGDPLGGEGQPLDAHRLGLQRAHGLGRVAEVVPPHVGGDLGAGPRVELVEPDMEVVQPLPEILLEGARRGPRGSRRRRSTVRRARTLERRALRPGGMAGSLATKIFGRFPNGGSVTNEG